MDNYYSQEDYTALDQEYNELEDHALELRQDLEAAIAERDRYLSILQKHGLCIDE